MRLVGWDGEDTVDLIFTAVEVRSTSGESQMEER